MLIEPLKIPGAYILKQSSFVDERGLFSRLFCLEELASILGKREIKQINFSKTLRPGMVRGLHLQQQPHTEMKFIRCINGLVWDVIVDLRPNSETFLQWHAEELSSENLAMMVIPEGCAHGFQTLQADSELIYLHTAYYSPESECGVNVLDRKLTIDWPLPVSGLSERDQNLPMIEELFPAASK